MKAVFFVCLSVFVFSSCKEDTICACLETGRKLDATAQEILKKGTSPEREKALIALKKERRKNCSEFDRMDASQMLERMEDCK